MEVNSWRRYKFEMHRFLITASKYVKQNQIEVEGEINKSQSQLEVSISLYQSGLSQSSRTRGRFYVSRKTRNAGLATQVDSMPMWVQALPMPFIGVISPFPGKASAQLLRSFNWLSQALPAASPSLKISWVGTLITSAKSLHSST